MSMTDARSVRRERYEAVLRTVDAQTGDPQPPGTRPVTVLQIRSRAHHGSDRFDPDAVRSAIRAAIENDDLLRYTDRDGNVRVCRTTDEALLELIEHEVEHESPRKDLIARCNELHSGGGDSE